MLSENKLIDFFNVLNDGIVIIDSNWNIINFNPLALNLLNISENKNFINVINDNFISDTHIESLDLNNCNSFTISRHERSNTVDLILKVNIFPYNKHKQKSDFLLLLKDETNSFQELLKKDRFLSMITHKIRTPIVALNYSMNLALRRKELKFSEDETDDFIQQASYKISEIGEIFEKIFTYSSLPGRKQSENEAFVLKAIINDAVERFRRKYKNIYPLFEIVIKENQENVEAFFPKDLALVIFENLIENAVKFNNSNTPQVIITIEHIENNLTRISIKDNGPGIPSESVNDIFEKFYQIDKHFTGTIDGIGLGLTLVKDILKEYNLSIKLQTELGKGSLFEFTLPAKP